MREIVLDTETTGLDPAAGHRIVEIACVELINHVSTGRHFQCYLNPDRDMPEEAFRVHGLSLEFLSDKPRFPDVCEAFLEFIADAPLVIHNAEFDLKFLNAELERCGKPRLAPPGVIDTVKMARERYPGAQANLDALCRRFEIDNTARDLHGALLDSELLALVYLELCGGRQPDLDLASLQANAALQALEAPRVRREPRPHAPSAEELAAHEALIARLKQPLWLS